MKTIQTDTYDGLQLVYYDEEWQTPNITEYSIFESFHTSKTLPFHYFAFPWATYVDNERINKRSQHLQQVVQSYIVNKPKDDHTQYCTVVQHIRFRTLIPLFKLLNINYVFASHCSISDKDVCARHNIHILPFPLFPVVQNDFAKESERTFLVNFVGYYNPDIYISNVRQTIFQHFEKLTDCCVRVRKEWHYHSAIYDATFQTDKEKEKEYIESLRSSKFTLCPSGSGPNSIRFWEALSFGTIPVLLADTLVLPTLQHVAWDDCIIVWKETNVDTLYDYLKTLDESKIVSMRANCMRIFHIYFSGPSLPKILYEYFHIYSPNVPLTAIPDKPVVIDCAEVPLPSMPFCVKSQYVNTDNHQYTLYISGFSEILPYFVTASNTNTYNLILSDEPEETIQRLDSCLRESTKLPTFDRTHIVFHYSTTEQKRWCDTYQFRSVVVSDGTLQRFQKEYVPKECTPPNWKYPSSVSFFEYYTNDEMKIVRLCGLEHNWGLLPHLTHSVYVFVQIPCYHGKWNFEYARNTLFTTNPNFPLANIVWEAPNIDTMLFAKEYGFRSILCHSACWIDTSLLDLSLTYKIYDIAVNPSAELSPTNNLVDKQYASVFFTIVNSNAIDVKDANTIYNRSYCGGALNIQKKICTFVGEYLSCGLPVVFTDNHCGVDSLLTIHNSIYVASDETSVKEGVALAIQNLHDGVFNPSDIRGNFLKQIESMRKNFVEAVQQIFDKHDVSRDSSTYFPKQFFHTCMKHTSLEYAISRIQELDHASL